MAMSASGQHPLHPAARRGSLVPWLGHKQEWLLPVLRELGVTMTASPLYYMGHNRELSLFSAVPEPMGLALDPMTNLRQLPAARRSKNYRRQSFGGGAAFRPESDKVGLAEMIRLAEDPMDSQRGHGATIIFNTYHLAGAVGTRGRTLDLELARAGLAHFKAERMDQPAEHAAVQVRRQFYAVIALQRGVVASPAAVEALIEAYAALEADGYWVKIEGFTESGPAKELTGGGHLLGGLSETGRPVVSCGPGGLHLPLLVSDISSCIGLGAAERFSQPDADKPAQKGPRHRLAYHPAFVHSFQIKGDAAGRAFAAMPCRCGKHPKGKPPQGKAADAHCAVVRVTEEREAGNGTQEERREWLRGTINLASHFGHDAGVDVTPYATFAALLEGIDAGRGDLAQVS
ncbi:MAG: hypothetical protein ACLGI5_10870 [Thermoleophilia bacterium]